MLFNSFTFLLIFLPLFLLIYFLRKSIKYKNIVLLIFSLLFYIFGEPKLFILLIAMILLNYLMAILMSQHINKRKSILVLCIILNLLVLFSFKYLNYILASFDSIFGADLLKLTLPLGISFYTFQNLSYIIDVYNNKVLPQRNLLTYSIYILCFPKLISGPIVRYSEMDYQLLNRKISIDSIIQGIRRFSIGLGKKVILSGSIALLADLIFDNYLEYGTLLLWLGAISYTFQIYFDFSGYSDMAIGLAHIIGFDFPENFNYPYIASSITDFWRRWHMTLSKWFRDYIYIPLGGNRVSKVKFIRNIFVVWILTGLWHGAGINFILWGLYYAIFLLIEKFFLQKLLVKIPKIIKHIYVMLIVIIGFVIFRSNDINQILYFLKGMFIWSGDNLYYFITNNISIITSLIILIICIFASMPISVYINKKFKNFKYLFLLKNLYCYIIYLLSLIMMLQQTYTSFVYFKF